MTLGNDWLCCACLIDEIIDKNWQESFYLSIKIKLKLNTDQIFNAESWINYIKMVIFQDF